jgi:pyruvate dehydrogenase E2 component (dihydrolipoamide acetyltransferase)
MAESKATIPHIQLASEVDVSGCAAARAALARLAREGEPIPSYNDMIVKAAALALRDTPRANGSWAGDRFELYSNVNVGIAVAAEDALVVPTVFDADHKGLRQIAAETRNLAARVRSGAVTPPELAGGTFTVSNLGMYGVDSFDAVINPPQAALLAVGAIADRAVVRDGELAVAPTMRLTLACDHRILYGADGAELLRRICALLEEPVLLAG